MLDEPTTGLHPRDVDRLLEQLDNLVRAGHSVVVVEHEMRVVAQADWVIDIGPGAGDQGGKVVVSGTRSRWPGTARAAPRRFWPRRWDESRHPQRGFGHGGLRGGRWVTGNAAEGDERSLLWSDWRSTDSGGRGHSGNWQAPVSALATDQQTEVFHAGAP